MPVYVYRCEQCGSEFEKRQSFTDAPLTECQQCHGTLRKVLTPAAVIYKGSGFYTTDYHGKSNGNGRNGSAEKDSSAQKSETAAAGESKESTASKESAKSASTSGE